MKPPPADRTISAEATRVADAALRLLPVTFDGERGLFCHKTVAADGLRNIGVDALYSAAALIGLLSCDELDDACAGLIGPGIDGLWRALSACEARGSTLGATLWALALADDPRADALVDRIGVALEPRRWASMDLGLAVHGLAQVAGRSGVRDRALRLAADGAAELRSRFAARASVFRGTARGGAPAAVRHLGMTSFASQVYPLHGLAGYASATDEAVAPEALAVADWLVAAQGPLGQWWWFYSTVRCRVVEGYPVYAVHQDAMAHMALLPLERHGSRAADKVALERGRRWLIGDNELRTALIDWDRPLFARAIQRTGGDTDGYAGWSPRQHASALAKSLLGRTDDGQCGPESLEIAWETRSYHLGWLLYARSLQEAVA
jgi:hypothetical protein